ncbi:hypothetical protein LDENG_00007890 [Lucifuga dentata]|nr:hypothetical protein LDENG_00007890 [Lucifuga dentata]
MAVHRRFPSSLMELERICRKKWDKLRRSRRAKLVEMYPRRFAAATAAKGGLQSTELRV